MAFEKGYNAVHYCSEKIVYALEKPHYAFIDSNDCIHRRFLPIASSSSPKSTQKGLTNDESADIQTDHHIHPKHQKRRPEGRLLQIIMEGNDGG